MNENHPKKLQALINKISAHVADGEKYWMEKKDEYSGECNLTGECGKSMKTFYYNMAQTCLESAKEIKKLNIPNDSEMLPFCYEKIREILARTPVPDEISRKIKDLLIPPL